MGQPIKISEKKWKELEELQKNTEPEQARQEENKSLKKLGDLSIPREVSLKWGKCEFTIRW